MEEPEYANNVENPYFHCGKCPKSYEQQYLLTKHLRNAHNETKGGLELPYQCASCDRAFKYKYDIDRHAVTHIDKSLRERPFLCPIRTCVKRFYTQKVADEHAQRVHKLQQFECADCSKKFKTSELLEQHGNKTHPEIPPYTCNFCYQSFWTNESLKNHIRRHLKEKPFKCDYKACGKDFGTKGALGTHKRTHLPENQRVVSCPICSKLFNNTTKGLKEHIDFVHNKIGFTCTFEGCGKLLSSEKNLRIHQAIHNYDEPSFPCPHCPKKLRHSGSLSRHIKRVHVNKSERTLTCYFCDKKLMTDDFFEAHVASHLNERPYKCGEDNCRKSFSGYLELKEHKEIHPIESQEKFQCTKCSKSLSSMYTLTKHMTLIHDRDPLKHKCNFCGKTFAKIYNMDRHTRFVHTNEKAYLCSKCSYSCADLSNLRRHQNFHHQVKCVEPLVVYS